MRATNFSAMGARQGASLKGVALRDGGQGPPSVVGGISANDGMGVSPDDVVQ